MEVSRSLGFSQDMTDPPARNPGLIFKKRGCPIRMGHLSRRVRIRR
jgi:hypothetical protein